MKKIIYVLFSLVFLLQQANAQVNKTEDWQKFYKFLGDNIKYPEKARLVDAQGNSIILLTITDGAIKKFTVNNAHPELGFDEEVTQKLFAYRNLSKSQDGNYALITSYRIVDSKSPIKNNDFVVPKGYSELKLTVMAYGITKVGAVDTSKVNPSNNDKSFKINFRQGSLQNADGKQPLIVVNDEVVEYSLMNTIEPKNIQSITILKDASSTLKYGEEGRNGVIIISTKDYTPKKTVK